MSSTSSPEQPESVPADEDTSETDYFEPLNEVQQTILGGVITSW